MSDKLKKIRGSANQPPSSIEAIRPMVSYGLTMVGKEVQGGGLINTLLVKHILKVNIDNGYAVGKNIVRKYIEISNTAFPTDKSCVLSKVKRKSEDFINIDIGNQFISVLLEVLQVQNQGLITYAKRNLSKKKIDIAYYYIATLKQKAVSGVDFDIDIANDIVKDKRQFESKYWFKDKYLLTVKAISSLSKNDTTKMFKMFIEEGSDIYTMVGFILYVAKDNPPEFILEDVEKVKTVEFAKNMQLVLAVSIEVNSLEQFFFNLIRIIK